MTDLKRLMQEGSSIHIPDDYYKLNQLEEIARKAREYQVMVSIKVESLEVGQMQKIAKLGGRGITFLFENS